MSKGLDALQFMRERDMFLPSCASTIEKELEAIEIIKECKIIHTDFGIDEIYIAVPKNKLDLLKEVLL